MQIKPSLSFLFWTKGTLEFREGEVGVLVCFGVCLFCGFFVMYLVHLKWSFPYFPSFHIRFTFLSVLMFFSCGLCSCPHCPSIELLKAFQAQVLPPKNTGQGCSGGSQQRSPGRKLKVSLGKFHGPLTSLGWTPLWTDNIPSTTKCSQEAGPDCGHIRGAQPSQHQPLQRSPTSSSTQIHRWASHTSNLSEAQQCQGTFTSLFASCYCTWKF